MPIACNASQNIVLAVSDTNKVGLVPAVIQSCVPAILVAARATCCLGAVRTAGAACVVGDRFAPLFSVSCPPYKCTIQ